MLHGIYQTSVKLKHTIQSFINRITTSMKVWVGPKLHSLAYWGTISTFCFPTIHNAAVHNSIYKACKPLSQLMPAGKHVQTRLNEALLVQPAHDLSWWQKTEKNPTKTKTKPSPGHPKPKQGQYNSEETNFTLKLNCSMNRKSCPGSLIDLFFIHFRKPVIVILVTSLGPLSPLTAL